MKIHLNGQETRIKATNLLMLLSEIGLDQRKLAIELNLEIVPKSLYASTPLASGDRIEIVHFVGGG